MIASANRRRSCLKSDDFLKPVQLMCGPGPPPAASSTAARHSCLTGMMGGMTTYSTFSYETVQLMETGSWGQAGMNILVTTVICLGLCFLGMGVGRMLVTPR